MAFRLVKVPHCLYYGLYLSCFSWVQNGIILVQKEKPLKERVETTNQKIRARKHFHKNSFLITHNHCNLHLVNHPECWEAKRITLIIHSVTKVLYTTYNCLQLQSWTPIIKAQQKFKKSNSIFFSTPIKIWPKNLKK
jgi:hypothetical protein